MRTHKAFTMIELLIVVTILAALLLVLLLVIPTQLSKSRDAQRKGDLEKIRIAFEDYYNDNDCYPDQTILDECRSDALTPYLNQVPCDPGSGEPYIYRPVAGAQCSGYRVWATLENEDDPVLDRLGCTPESGCGLGAGYEDYNYGISAGVPVVIDGGIGGGDGGGEEGPTTTYACSPGIPGVSPGACNVYADPDAAGCPGVFENINCDNACGDQANWCAQ